MPVLTIMNFNMASKSVYNNPDYVAKLPKETFPMTQEIDFSSVAGSLVPVFCDFLHPGEKISGHAEMITRTNELQTASFVDIDEYIEYFFVPAIKLNQIFGEWFFNIDDRQTVWRPAELPERANVLPNVPIDLLRNYLDDIKAVNPSRGEMSPSEGMIRLMQHFRYDVYHMFDVDGVTDTVETNFWNVSLAPFQAYQAIYYDYYRDSLWQNNDVEAYNTDDWLTSTGIFTSSRLNKIFQVHQRRQNADYYTSVHPSPLQNATGMLNIDGVREAALLRINQWLDGAGISFSFGKSSLSSAGNTNVSMISDLAPYTGSGLESYIIGNGDNIGDVSSLLTNNKTYVTGTSQKNPPSDIQPVAESLPPGRTVVYVERSDSTGGSGTKTGHLEAMVGDDPIYLAHHHELESGTVTSYTGTVPGLTGQSSPAQINAMINGLKSSISSTAIRSMFALEKLAQITGRAGKHYDDQVFAHYGFKVSSAYGLETQMIGQQHSTVHIGEIVSPTTVPDGSVAGEIVGKGYGAMSGDKAVDFVAPCHGYFMAIYSAVPRRVYTPCGNPKEYSQLYRFDFMQPELMNLGQQPLFFTEFNLKRATAYTPVAGWQWRYMENKTRVPMAIGALSRFSETDSTRNGILQDWTIQYPVLNLNPDIAFGGSLGYLNFMVMPSAFNSIMLVQYSTHNIAHPDINWHVARLFDRDPLYHKLQMKMYKTSYMSKFGEPRID